MAAVSLHYPLCLANQSLPLMQPAIAQSVNHCVFSAIGSQSVFIGAVLISEYACPVDQVEVEGMIAFFQRRIPSKQIEKMKRAFPDVSSCLEEGTPKQTAIFVGSRPLKNSRERKLIALTCAFFGYHNRLFLNSLKPDQQRLVRNENPEYYDFLGRIPGVAIVERCYPQSDCRLCHTFIFGEHEWYRKINPNTALLGHPKKVLDFLNTQGYTKAEKPSPNQVVVYHTAASTHHFARVVHVDPENGITVLSKFGSFHVYQHRIALAQFHYGNSVTFLNLPRMVATS